MVKGPNAARFEAIFANGRRVSGRAVRVCALFPGTGAIGIATAKKIGNRPRRNHAKRRVREAIRTLEPAPDVRLDYVVVVSSSAVSLDFVELRTELASLLYQARERWAEELASS